MPTVPVVDQTASPAPQYAAPGVAPVRNDAPQQMDALGQTLQQTGELAMRTGATIGDRVQDQVDDAKTKQAETAALTQANDVLYHPENGYFRKLGQAAVDNYDPAKQAVVKAFQDQMDGLGNPIQKQMFTQVMNQHLLSVGKSMADYNHSQSVAWSASESKARADSLQLQALNVSDSRYQADADGNMTGDFAKYTAQMETEVYKTAALAGFDPDSAQAQAMIREQWNGLNHGIIARLLDNHDAKGADRWLKEQQDKGNIDMRTSEQLGSAVKDEVDRQTVEDVVDKQVIPGLLSSGKQPVTLAMPVAGGSINVTAGLGEPRAGGRTHDGIDIAVPVGTQVLAPAAGKVTKVWNDDKFGGGLSMEMQLPNGYTAGFAHLSAANVRPGDEIQQGATLGLSGKSGNATGPTLHYMMKDADGNYVDPRQVSQPQPAATSFTDPTMLEKGIQQIQGMDDVAPQLRKRMITYMEQQYGHYRAIDNEQYEQVKQQATDAYYNSGGNYGAIPANIRTQLKPEDRYKLQQPLPTKDNVDVQADFILHPENQTVDWVQQHRTDFTNGTYLSYLQKVQSDANSPDKEKNASLDATQMDNILYQNGMANLVQPKSDPDKQAAVALKSRIMDQFVSEQNSTSQPLTRDRKAQIITQTIADQVSVHHSLWFDNSNVPVVGLTNSQAQNAYATVGTQKVKLSAIPIQDQVQITTELRRTNQPVTQQKIAEYWVRAQNQRGKGVPTF